MNNSNNIIKYLRSFRLLEYAIFDFIATFFGTFFFAKYFNFNINKSFLLVIPISIIIHKLFGIDTLLTKQVFGKNNYFVKLIIAILIITSFFV